MKTITLLYIKTLWGFFLRQTLLPKTRLFLVEEYIFVFEFEAMTIMIKEKKLVRHVFFLSQLRD